MFCRSNILPSLNYITETIRETEGRMLASLMYTKSSMVHLRNDTERVTSKYSGGKKVPVPRGPPQTSHGITRGRIRVSKVKGP